MDNKTTVDTPAAVGKAIPSNPFDLMKQLRDSERKDNTKMKSQVQMNRQLKQELKSQTIERKLMEVEDYTFTEEGARRERAYEDRLNMEAEDELASQLEKVERDNKKMDFREKIRQEAEERRKQEELELEKKRQAAERRRQAVVERIRRKQEEEERRIREAEEARLREIAEKERAVQEAIERLRADRAGMEVEDDLSAVAEQMFKEELEREEWRRKEALRLAAWEDEQRRKDEAEALRRRERLAELEAKKAKLAELRQKQKLSAPAAANRQQDVESARAEARKMGKQMRIQNKAKFVSRKRKDSVSSASTEVPDSSPGSGSAVASAQQIPNAVPPSPGIRKGSVIGTPVVPPPEAVAEIESLTSETDLHRYLKERMAEKRSLRLEIMTLRGAGKKSDSSDLSAIQRRVDEITSLEALIQARIDKIVHQKQDAAMDNKENVDTESQGLNSPRSENNLIGGDVTSCRVRTGSSAGFGASSLRFGGASPLKKNMTVRNLGIAGGSKDDDLYAQIEKCLQESNEIVVKANVVDLLTGHREGAEDSELAKAMRQAGILKLQMTDLMSKITGGDDMVGYGERMKESIAKLVKFLDKHQGAVPTRTLSRTGSMSAEVIERLNSATRPEGAPSPPKSRPPRRDSDKFVHTVSSPNQMEDKSSPCVTSECGKSPDNSTLEPGIALVGSGNAGEKNSRSNAPTLMLDLTTSSQADSTYMKKSTPHVEKVSHVSPRRAGSPRKELQSSQTIASTDDKSKISDEAYQVSPRRVSPRRDLLSQPRSACNGKVHNRQVLEPLEVSPRSRASPRQVTTALEKSIEEPYQVSPRTRVSPRRELLAKLPESSGGLDKVVRVSPRDKPKHVKSDTLASSALPSSEKNPSVLHSTELKKNDATIHASNSDTALNNFLKADAIMNANGTVLKSKVPHERDNATSGNKDSSDAETKSCWSNVTSKKVVDCAIVKSDSESTKTAQLSCDSPTTVNSVGEDSNNKRILLPPERPDHVTPTTTGAMAVSAPVMTDERVRRTGKKTEVISSIEEAHEMENQEILRPLLPADSCTSLFSAGVNDNEGEDEWWGNEPAAAPETTKAVSEEDDGGDSDVDIGPYGYVDEKSDGQEDGEAFDYESLEGWNECLHTSMATAAHHAAFYGFAPVLEMLSRHFDVFALDKNGRTPLFYASLRNNLDCVLLLVSLDAQWIEVGDSRGDTAIHAAAISGGLEVLQFLLSCEVNPSIANFEGLTPVHLAKTYEGLLALYEANATMYCVDSHNRMPVWYSAKDGNAAGVGLLCSLMPPEYITWQDSEGNTILHIACMAGHSDVVEVICMWITSLDDFYILNKKNYTPAHTASSAEVLKKLYEYGVNLWTADPKWRYPLFLNSFQGRVDCVALLIELALLKNEALISAQDVQGDTALHAAVINGHIQCTSLLLFFLRDHPNSKGLRPSQLAQRAGHNQLANFVYQIDQRKEYGETSCDIFECTFENLAAVTLYYGSRWTKLYDAYNNEVYYYDRVLGNSQWHRPDSYDENPGEETSSDKAREVLVNFYMQYNPDKLINVNEILHTYKNNYSELFVQLAQRYQVEDISMFTARYGQ
eukprot:CAMPEP_0185021000 /NCGR_PEP_ID=MMETSP1103-20130426/3649_1 /TAXON_ID=36769 /ORGANISM="Paraphysomonas bandaiensis, Strain Caron Lab Isolate" /LENGTH=1577 /DNA_ID=CAMNT_0027552265 /DNA_START=163 /DNA_END=4896 /DNA_ORIENTATION=+